MRTSAGISSKRDRLRGLLLPVLALFVMSSCATPGLDESKKEGYAVASWYGPGFHGRPTASGETFDMYDLTCAHRSLPFGTRLEVTNPENGRSTQVVVNDRGPFVRGRDLDLSYAAAREIGLVGSGTGRVMVKYLGRDTGYVKYIKEETVRGPFTIQVGSFREPSNASRLKRGLEFNHDGVYIMKARINGEVYHRVRVGRFSSRDRALSRARVLADEGYDILIAGYE
jgi:rare lipoprotein A